MKEGENMEIKCKICNTTIKSLHRHDFKYCDCKNCFIDGGNDYVRYGVTHGVNSVEFLENGKILKNCDDKN